MQLSNQILVSSHTITTTKSKLHFYRKCNITFLQARSNSDRYQRIRVPVSPIIPSPRQVLYYLCPRSRFADGGENKKLRDCQQLSRACMCTPCNLINYSDFMVMKMQHNLSLYSIALFLYKGFRKEPLLRTWRY